MFIVIFPFLILFVLLNGFHFIPSRLALGRTLDRAVVKYFPADWGDELASLLGVLELCILAAYGKIEIDEFSQQR